VQKNRDANWSFAFWVEKTNGLYFDAEVGLEGKKCQTLLCASTGKAY